MFRMELFVLAVCICVLIKTAASSAAMSVNTTDNNATTTATSVQLSADNNVTTASDSDHKADECDKQEARTCFMSYAKYVTIAVSLKGKPREHICRMKAEALACEEKTKRCSEQMSSYLCLFQSLMHHVCGKANEGSFGSGEIRNSEEDFGSFDLDDVDWTANSDSGRRSGERGSRSHESGRRSDESGSRSDETGSKSDESGSRSDETGSKSDESGSRSDESGSRSDESGSRSDESGSKSHGSGSRSDESGSRSHESGSKSDESGSKSHETGSRSDDKGSRSDESGSKSHGSGSRSDESGSRSDETGSRSDESGSKSHGSGSRSDESGSRSDASGSKSHGSGSRSDESGSRSDETGSKSDESGSRSDESGSKSHGSGSRSDESGGRSDETGSRSDESGSKSDESGSKSHGSGSRSDASGSRSDESGSRSDESGSRSDDSDRRSSEMDSSSNEEEEDGSCSPTCDLQASAVCFLQFMDVLSQQSITRICRQSVWSAKCMSSAVVGCRAAQKHAVMALVNKILLTRDEYCGSRSCELEKAAACLEEAGTTIRILLKELTLAPLLCGNLKGALACVYNHASNCETRDFSLMEDNDDEHMEMDDNIGRENNSSTEVTSAESRGDNSSTTQAQVNVTNGSGDDGMDEISSQGNNSINAEMLMAHLHLIGVTAYGICREQTLEKDMMKGAWLGGDLAFSILLGLPYTRSRDVCGQVSIHEESQVIMTGGNFAKCRNRNYGLFEDTGRRDYDLFEETGRRDYVLFEETGRRDYVLFEETGRRDYVLFGETGSREQSSSAESMGSSENSANSRTSGSSFRMSESMESSQASGSRESHQDSGSRESHQDSGSRESGESREKVYWVNYGYREDYFNKVSDDFLQGLHRDHKSSQQIFHHIISDTCVNPRAVDDCPSESDEVIGAMDNATTTATPTTAKCDFEAGKTCVVVSNVHGMALEVYLSNWKNEEAVREMCFEVHRTLTCAYNNIIGCDRNQKNLVNNAIHKLLYMVGNQCDDQLPSTTMPLAPTLPAPTQTPNRCPEPKPKCRIGDIQEECFTQSEVSCDSFNSTFHCVGDLVRPCQEMQTSVATFMLDNLNRPQGCPENDPTVHFDFPSGDSSILAKCSLQAAKEFRLAIGSFSEPTQRLCMTFWSFTECHADLKLPLASKYLLGRSQALFNDFISKHCMTINDEDGIDMAEEAAPVCEQPLMIGPCKAAFQQFFYNSTSQMCELFIYGGCDGNDNRFDNITECQEKCVKDEMSDGECNLSKASICLSTHLLKLFTKLFMPFSHQSVICSGYDEVKECVRESMMGCSSSAKLHHVRALELYESVYQWACPLIRPEIPNIHSCLPHIAKSSLQYFSVILANTGSYNINETCKELSYALSVVHATTLNCSESQKDEIGDFLSDLRLLIGDMCPAITNVVHCNGNSSYLVEDPGEKNLSCSTLPVSCDTHDWVQCLPSTWNETTICGATQMATCISNFIRGCHDSDIAVVYEEFTAFLSQTFTLGIVKPCDVGVIWPSTFDPERGAGNCTQQFKEDLEEKYLLSLNLDRSILCSLFTDLMECMDEVSSTQPLVSQRLAQVLGSKLNSQLSELCQAAEVSPCEVGDPLKDENGDEYFCGRGSSGFCPEGSHCVISPTDSYAVCCAKGKNSTEKDCGSAPADLVFLVDESSSIGSSNFQIQKQFVIDLLHNSVIATNIETGIMRVALVTFSRNSTKRFGLNTYNTTADMSALINSIPYDKSGTEIEKGLRYVREVTLSAAEGARSEAPKIVILLTDGSSSDNSETEANLLRDMDVTLLVIGIGNVDMNQLKAIAANDKFLFTVADFSELSGIAEQFVASIPCPEEPLTCHLSEAVHCYNGQARSLLSGLYPVRARSTVCSTTQRYADCVTNMTVTCSSEKHQKFLQVSDWTQKLVSAQGICKQPEDITPKYCHPEEAAPCLATMSKVIARYQHTPTRTAICSQIVTTEMCVLTSIKDCDEGKRSSVLQAYQDMTTLAHLACMAPQIPKPMPPDCKQEGHMCNDIEALNCLVSAHTSLVAAKRNRETACNSLVVAKNCVKRQIAGCEAGEKATIHRMYEKLVGRRGHMCPEIYCERCAALQCVEDLTAMLRKGGKEMCNMIDSTKRCVKKRAKHCSHDERKKIYAKLDYVVMMTTSQCEKVAMHCITAFKSASLQILQHNQPTKSTDSSSMGSQSNSASQSNQSNVSNESQSDAGEESQSNSSSDGGTSTETSAGSSGMDSESGSQADSGSASRSNSGSSSKWDVSAGSQQETAEEDEILCDDQLGSDFVLDEAWSIDLDMCYIGGTSSGESGSKSEYSCEEPDKSSTRSSSSHESLSAQASESTSTSGESQSASGQSSRSASTNGESQSASGQSSGSASTSGESQSASGQSSGSASTSGESQSASGQSSGSASTSGESSGNASTSGESQSASGQSSGSASTNGESQSASGQSSGSASTSGESQSASGQSSGSTSTSGESQSASGQSSGSASTSGESQSASGQSSGSASTSGESQSASGQSSGSASTSEESSGSASTSWESQSTSGQSSGSGETKVCMSRLAWMCKKASMSWECAQKAMLILPVDRQRVLRQALTGVYASIQYKCAASKLQCFSCNKEDSNDACNTRSVETCAANKQACETVVDFGAKVITKGCVNPSSCRTQCTGNSKKCSYCCHDNLCNQPWDSVITESRKCVGVSAVKCAFSLVKAVAHTEELSCSEVETSLECMKKNTIKCISSQYMSIKEQVPHLESSALLTTCRMRQLHCHCGLCGSLALGISIQNNFRTDETVCLHLMDTIQGTSLATMEQSCSFTDFQASFLSLNLAWSVIGDTCHLIPKMNDTSTRDNVTSAESGPSSVESPTSGEITANASSEAGTSSEESSSSREIICDPKAAIECFDNDMARKEVIMALMYGFDRVCRLKDMWMNCVKENVETCSADKYTDIWDQVMYKTSWVRGHCQRITMDTPDKCDIDQAMQCLTTLGKMSSATVMCANKNLTFDCVAKHTASCLSVQRAPLDFVMGELKFSMESVCDISMDVDDNDIYHDLADCVVGFGHRVHRSMKVIGSNSTTLICEAAILLQSCLYDEKLPPLAKIYTKHMAEIATSFIKHICSSDDMEKPLYCHSCRGREDRDCQSSTDLTICDPLSERCSSMLHTREDGTQLYIKGCMAKDQCETVCPTSTNCSYCCQTDFCNAAVLPDVTVTTPPPNIVTEQAACGYSVADIVILLDESSSITKQNFFIMANFVNNIITQLNIGEDSIRLGLATFSSQGHLGFSLDSYYDRDPMIGFVTQLAEQYGDKSGTNVAAGLDLVRSQIFGGNGNRPDVQDVILLLTDGEFQSGYESAVNAVQQANISVLVVGIGDGVLQAQLRDVASDPRYVFTVEDFSVLDTIVGDFVQTIPCPPEPPSCTLHQAATCVSGPLVRLFVTPFTPLQYRHTLCSDLEIVQGCLSTSLMNCPISNTNNMYKMTTWMKNTLSPMCIEQIPPVRDVCNITTAEMCLQPLMHLLSNKVLASDVCQTLDASLTCLTEVTKGNCFRDVVVSVSQTLQIVRGIIGDTCSTELSENLCVMANPVILRQSCDQNEVDNCVEMFKDFVDGYSLFNTEEEACKEYTIVQTCLEDKSALCDPSVRLTANTTVMDKFAELSLSGECAASTRVCPLPGQCSIKNAFELAVNALRTSPSCRSGNTLMQSISNEIYDCNSIQRYSSETDFKSLLSECPPISLLIPAANDIFVPLTECVRDFNTAITKALDNYFAGIRDFCPAVRGISACFQSFYDTLEEIPAGFLSSGLLNVNHQVFKEFLDKSCNGSEIVICEDFTKTIECPEGEVIDIQEAFYGREDRITCSLPNKPLTDTACSSPVALDRYKEICSNKTTCNVTASNSVTGDPCVNTYKYARITYSCVAASPDVTTETDDCLQKDVVRCMGSYLSNAMFIGLFRNHDREELCRSSLSLDTCIYDGMRNCSTRLQNQYKHLYDIGSSVISYSGVCEEADGENEEEDRISCSPHQAWECIARLGMDLSYYETSRDRGDICRLAKHSTDCFHHYLYDCTDPINTAMSITMNNVIHYALRMCHENYMEPKDTVYPSPPPICVDPLEMTGYRCNHVKALQSLSNLFEEIFNPYGSQQRLCVEYANSLQSIYSNINACPSYIRRNVLSGLETVKSFKATDTCDVEIKSPCQPPPSDCKIHRAEECVDKLKVKLSDESSEMDSAICSMRAEVKQCIDDNIEECSETDVYQVTQKYYAALQIIGTYCDEGDDGGDDGGEEVDPDVTDIYGCISSFETKVSKVLELATRSAESGSAGSTVSDDSRSGQGSAGSASTESTAESKSGSADSASGSAAGSKSGSADSNPGSNSGSNSGSADSASGSADSNPGSNSGSNSGSAAGSNSGSKSGSADSNSGSADSNPGSYSGSNSGSADSASGSAAGSNSGSKSGSKSGSADSASGSAAGSKSGSADSNPGSNSGSNSGSADSASGSADSNPGSNSGSNSGSAAGSNSGSNSGSKSGSAAGSNSGSAAGSNSGSKSGSKSGSAAGSNSGSKSGSKSGSAAGSKSGSKSGSAAGSNSGPTTGSGQSSGSAAGSGQSSGSAAGSGVNKELAGLCEDVKAAWTCIQKNLPRLSYHERVILNHTLYAVYQATDYICKPQLCHSCTELEDNDMCNKQHPEECRTEEVCYARTKDSKLYKGCQSPTQCDRSCGSEQDCGYCCRGYLCNKPSHVEDQLMCDMSKAVTCAMDIVSIVTNTDTITERLLKASLTCLETYSRDCPSDKLTIIYKVSKLIREMLTVSGCAAESSLYQHCGTIGVLSLGRIASSPFASDRTKCSLLNATQTLLDKIENSEQCFSNELAPILQSMDDVKNTFIGDVCSDDDVQPKCKVGDIFSCFSIVAGNFSMDRMSLMNIPPCVNDTIWETVTCLVDKMAACSSVQKATVSGVINTYVNLVENTCSAASNVSTPEKFISSTFDSDLELCISDFSLAVMQGLYGDNTDICDAFLTAMSCVGNLQLSPFQKALSRSFIMLVSESYDNTYSCSSQTGSEIVICEDFTKTIECPEGEVIDIQEAFYGREDRITCSLPNKPLTDTACSSPVALDRYKEICFNKNTCSVTASNSVTGDPCVNTYKYARIVYSCNAINPALRSNATSTSGSMEVVDCDLDIIYRYLAHSTIQLYTSRLFSQSSAYDTCRNEAVIKSSVETALTQCTAENSLNTLLEFFDKAVAHVCFGDIPAVDDQMDAGQCDIQMAEECFRPIIPYFGASIKDTENLCWELESLHQCVQHYQTDCPVSSFKSVIDSLAVVMATFSGRCVSLSPPSAGCSVAKGLSCLDSLIESSTDCSNLDDVRNCVNNHTLGCSSLQNLVVRFYLIVSVKNHLPSCNVDLQSNDPVVENLINSCVTQLDQNTTVFVKRNSPSTQTCDTLSSFVECLREKSDDMNIIVMKQALESYLPMYKSMVNSCRISSEQFEHPGSCPVLAVGSCEKECFYDAHCQQNEKCCSNGCGQRCVMAVGDSVIAFDTPRQTSGSDATDYTYTLLSDYGYVLRSTSILFEVKSCNDAHVGLKEDEDPDGNLYEIVLGGWGNTKSVIRTMKQGDHKVEQIEAVLDCNLYKQFNVSWSGGVVTVMRDTDSGWVQLMSWQDLGGGLDIKIVGLTTARWSSGSWKIPQSLTEDQGGSCDVDIIHSCMTAWTTYSVFAPFLDDTDKQHLCGAPSTSLGRCVFQATSSCPQYVSQHLDMMRYLAWTGLHMTGFCKEEIYTCSPSMAVQCMSEFSFLVGQKSAMLGDTSSMNDNPDVCSEYRRSRDCTTHYLYKCDASKKQSVQKTFEELECLMGNQCVIIEEPPVTEKPAKCIDTEMGSGLSCSMIDAIGCLNGLRWSIASPFSSPGSICLSYSKSVQCFVDHVSKCHPRFVDLAMTVFEEFSPFVSGCPTVIRSPCQEEEDLCKYTELTACVDVVREMMLTSVEDAQLCVEFSNAWDCINDKSADCPRNYVISIQKNLRNLQNEKPFLTCDDTMQVCYYRYIEIVVEILTKQPNAVAPASGSVSEQASGSASEQASGSASESASGSASEQASGSASEQASGSASESASGSASEQASGSASESASGSVSEQASGSASESVSGSASEQASGSASEQASGSASEAASGSASEQASGSASEQASGSASESSSGSASEPASGSASEQASGSASESSSGSASEPASTFSSSEVWDNSKSCDDVVEAYSCIQDKLSGSGLPNALISMFDSIIGDLHNIIEEKCQGMSCYYCKKKQSNGKCNENLSVCSTSEQACETVVEKGKISKGCVAPDKCTPGTKGKKTTYCCYGHLCNEPGDMVYYDPPICDILVTTQTVITLLTKVIEAPNAYTTVFCNDVPLTVKELTTISSTCSIPSRDRITTLQSRLLMAEESMCTIQVVCQRQLALDSISAFNTTIQSSASSDVICVEYEKTMQSLLTQWSTCTAAEIADMQNIMDSVKATVDLTCQLMPDIKYTQPADVIRIVEGGDAKMIEFVLTEDPATKCNKDSCHVVISLTLVHTSDDKTRTCADGSLIPQLVVGNYSTAGACGYNFTSGNWATNVSVPFLAVSDGLYDGDQTVEVVMTATKYEDDIPVIVRQIATYQFLVIDGDRKGILCTSINDPHIRTFDQLYYDNFLKGEFHLYRHTTLPYEVRVVFNKCGKASCNCAVMVKSGDDFFTVDVCSPQAGVQIAMHFTDSLTVGTQMYIIPNGEKFQQFKIILPSGTYVIVQLLRRLINVQITPSPSDRGRTEGLCGNYDGDAANDLMMPDGTQDEVDQKYLIANRVNSRDPLFPNNFNKAWQVKENYWYFKKFAASIQSFSEENPVYCTCPASASGTSDPCQSIGAAMTCPFLIPGVDLIAKAKSLIADATENPQDQAQVGRRRRQATGNGLEQIGIFENEEMERASWPAGNWTEAMAEAHCEALLTNSNLAQSCAGVDVANATDVVSCMADIQRTKGTEFDSFSTTNQMGRCVNELQRDPAFNTDPAARAVATGILDQTCEDNCNSNGDCQAGVCRCYSGFMGTSCSVKEGEPPVVDRLQQNTCNTQTGAACNSVAVAGEKFVDLPTLTCHFTTVERIAGVFLKTTSETTALANFISFNLVECELPASLTPAVPLRAVLVSVSNDGNAKSTSDQYFIGYNSLCYTCDASSCQTTLTGCVIDAQCYGIGDVSAANPCHFCDPVTSVTAWTVKLANYCPNATTTTPAPTTTPPTTTTTTTLPPSRNDAAALQAESSTPIIITGIIAGILLLVLVVLASAFCIHRKRSEILKDMRLRGESDSESSNGSRSRWRKSPRDRDMYFDNSAYHYGFKNPQAAFADNIPTRHSRMSRRDPTLTFSDS